jgi:hypothetical protein
MNDANDILWEGPQGALIRHRSMGDNSHSTTVLCKTEKDRAFYSGNTFHTYADFTLASAASITIKTVTTRDICISYLDFELDDSVLKIEIISGGTEGGTFGTALPIIKSNTMSNTPGIESTTTMNSGGTITGGTVIDYHKLSATKGGAIFGDSELIALPPGTYYFRLTNVGNQSIIGLTNLRWSEY